MARLPGHIDISSAGQVSANLPSAISSAVLWEVVDGHHDGVALADDDGILTLVRRPVQRA